MNLKKSAALISLSKEELIELIEKERHESQILEDSIKAATLMTWEYDTREERLKLGKGTAQIIGFADDENISLKDLIERIHPEDNQIMQLNFIKHLEKYPENHEYHVRIRDKDEKYRWVSSIGKLFKDEEGHSIKLAGVLKDITKTKKTETQYLHSENRFQVLAEHAKEGIIIYDDGIVTDVNDAAQQIFELSYSEFVGKKLSQLLDKTTFEKLENVKNKNEYVDFKFLNKNGEKAYLEVLNKQTKSIGIILVNNISTRKTAEIKLLKYQQELERIVKERTNEIEGKNKQIETREKSYQALLTNMQGLAYRYTPIKNLWKTEYISQGAFELTGYMADDFLSERVKMENHLIEDSINKTVWKEIKMRLKAKEPFNVHYPIVTKSGAHKWVQDRGIGVYNEHGKLIALEGLMIDITREKLQEEKLMIAQQEIVSQNERITEREKSYSALLTNLQGMAYRVLNDKNSSVVYLSNGCLALTGYTPEEIKNKNRFFETKIVRKDYQRKVHLIIEEAIKNKMSYETSYPIICKDKSEKWVSERGLGIFDESGKLITQEGFIIDITESKNLEKQLRLAQATIDMAPIIIEWVKEDGSFFYINNEAEKMSQFTREELLSKKVYELDPTLTKESWANLFKKRKKKNIRDEEVTYTQKDGTILPALINASNIEFDGTAYNIAYINIITNLKNIEQELKEANYELSASEEELRQQSEELHTLNENLEAQKQELENSVYQLKNTRDQLIHTEKMAGLGVLVAGIAHELNNPIGYIKSSSEALMMVLEDLKEELNGIHGAETETIKELSIDFEQMASHINSGAEQAAEIVRGLRTFSRMDKEKIERHNIHDTINNVLLMLHNAYKYEINIIKEFAVLPPIECAPGQINQVFMNLINNAIQAIDGKGNILIKTELVDDRIIVSVKDDGPGIPPELQNRIFEPFYTTKEPGKGTGLGLSISMGIIQDHDGSIELKSDEQGTTFTISLPLKQH